MSGLTRWLPRLYIVLGVLHLCYGVVESPGVVGDMLGDGLVDTADTGERGYVVWFVIGGLALISIGALTGWVVRTTGRIPVLVGWWLGVIGLLIVVTEPASGGWLVLVLGALTVIAARQPASA